MTKAKEAKFTLLYGITPEKYFNQKFESFNHLTNSKFIKEDVYARELLYNQLTEALRKIEEV